MKDYKVDFYDRDETLIETVTFFGCRNQQELQFVIKERVEENDAHTHSVPEEIKKVWIKSKVVVFYGINNQFAGMYIADNQEQIKMLEKLVYGFPMHFRVYDEIPRITDCIKSINANGNVITTEIEEIDGNIKSHDFATHLNDDDFKNFFAEVEEIFGSS